MAASQVEGITDVEPFLKGYCLLADLVATSIGSFRLDPFFQLGRPSLTITIITICLIFETDQVMTDSV